MFKKSILHVMEIESGRNLSAMKFSPHDVLGGFTDDKDDPGGRTNWGIIQRNLDRFMPGRDIETLTLKEAHDIYLEHFYNKIDGEFIDSLSPSVCLLVFEYGVHRGPAMAITALQQLLNLNNNRGMLWKDIEVDGVMGGETRSALESFAQRRGDNGGEINFIMQLSSFIVAYYIRRATINETMEKYYYGWCERATRTHTGILKKLL